MNFSEIMNKYQAHPTAVIDEGALIGEGCTIWHFVIFPEAQVLVKDVL